MYQKFTATTVDVDRASKEIRIAFSVDVDPDTVDSRTVFVYKENIGDAIKATLSVNGHVITVSLHSEIEPNVKYVVCVSKDIKTILGMSLDHALKHTFKIESKVRSNIKIIAPSNFEELKKPHILWKEIPYEGDPPYGKFLVQVALDHLFANIVSNSFVEDKSEITLADIEKGHQYFVRVRAEMPESDFGPWSEPVTFSLAGRAIQSSDSDAIFVRELELLSSPEPGCTDTSFIFEFDDEIDPNSIDDDSIVVLQRRF